jgi:hypothetical protein
MTYTAEISRVNPSAFVFLIDQSGSMADEFEQSDIPVRKDVFVADVLNRTLQELAIRCNRDDGIRDYFSLTVIGYGGKVSSLAGGEVQGQVSIPISSYIMNPLRIEERLEEIPDGDGGLIEESKRYAVYIDPMSNGGTPMCEAFAAATSVLHDWISQHPDAYPPIVFNLTDGESTDGSPVNAAYELTSLATNDGNALLFNIHVSAISTASIRFPVRGQPMPDRFAEQLLSMSSPLTPALADAFSVQTGMALSAANRCFIYNAGPVDIVAALEIGTRNNLMR